MSPLKRIRGLIITTRNSRPIYIIKNKKRGISEDHLPQIGASTTTSIAFFLSPTGDLVHVPLDHISTVIAYPEKFGLTSEEIRAVYDRHGERVGVEGEARKEILLELISQG